MKINLIYFGKASQSAAREEEAYLKRVRAWCPLEVVELKPSKLNDRQSGLAQEAKRYRTKFPDEPPLIILDEQGKCQSSVEFASQLSNWMQMGKPQFNFLVGSAYGVHPELKKQAIFKLSLSPMTLTHDHARIILIEQIYRALAIQRNHPYHHA